MKKRISYVLIAVLLSFAISGCSSNNNSDAKEIEQLKKEIADLKAENESLKAKQESTEKAASADESTLKIEETNENTSSGESIKANQIITIKDTCEFTLKKATFSKKVVPPKPDGFYTYYEAKEPNTTYLDVIISYKNLLGSGLIADEAASVKCIYNDKYEYPSFSAIEENNGGNFGYTNITNIDPLKVGRLHYLCEVPDEVQKAKDSVEVIITVNGKDYKYKVK